MTKAGLNALANLRADGWRVLKAREYSSGGVRWEFYRDGARVGAYGATDDEALLWCCLEASVLHTRANFTAEPEPEPEPEPGTSAAFRNAGRWMP